MIYLKITIFFFSYLSTINSSHDIKLIDEKEETGIKNKNNISFDFIKSPKLWTLAIATFALILIYYLCNKENKKQKEVLVIKKSDRSIIKKNQNELTLKDKFEIMQIMLPSYHDKYDKNIKTQIQEKVAMADWNININYFTDKGIDTWEKFFLEINNLTEALYCETYDEILLKENHHKELKTNTFMYILKKNIESNESLNDIKKNKVIDNSNLFFTFIQEQIRNAYDKINKNDKKIDIF